MDGDNGLVSWNNDCDLEGNNIEEVKEIPGERCGLTCFANEQCTHFAWVKIGKGICILKKGRTDPKDILAALSTKNARTCGYVTSRINGKINCQCKRAVTIVH